MTKLNTIPIIEFKTAKAFETWLLKNHDNSNGLNTGHVERLINEGRMKPAGLKAVEKAKADGSIIKPFDEDELFQMVKKYLGE